MYHGGPSRIMRGVPTCTLAPSLRVESPGMDVGALLQRVIDGDQWAWDEIVGQFGGLVWSVARSYRLGASTDDVVQTVWLRLAEHCDRIREPERLAAWLATTTRNEALRVATREGRVLQRPDVVEQPDPAAALLDELAVDDDTLAHVMSAFRQLSDSDQQLLRLVCAVPVLDYATIAELLDRSIGSIGPSRARALDKLRKLLPAGLYDAPATLEDETT